MNLVESTANINDSSCWDSQAGFSFGCLRRVRAKCTHVLVMLVAWSKYALPQIFSVPVCNVLPEGIQQWINIDSTKLNHCYVNYTFCAPGRVTFVPSMANIFSKEVCSTIVCVYQVCLHIAEKFCSTTVYIMTCIISPIFPSSIITCWYW